MSKEITSGRKRKLKDLTEDDYKMIMEAAGNGLSEKQIALLLGVSQSTITREKRANKHFEHAIKKGRVKAINAVSSKLFDNAMSGKETSAIFFLKNRAPDQWSDRQEPSTTINLNQIINDAKDRIKPPSNVNIIDAKKASNKSPDPLITNQTDRMHASMIEIEPEKQKK